MVERLYIDLDLIKYVFPEGFPRNSFIILCGEGGSGKSILVTTIASSILSSNEPVIYVALDDDPYTIVNQFNSMNISLEDFIKNNLFHVIDGYTYMMKTRRADVSRIVSKTIDPHDLDTSISQILSLLSDYNYSDKGIMIIDSLNEFLNYHEISRVIEFIKIIRANVSKLRNIVVFAILHTSTDYYMEFLHSIEHLVDGIIYTETVTEPELIEKIKLPLRRLLVKKLKNTSHLTGWVLYVIDREGVKPVRIVKESE